jgi:acyl carrier protein
MLPAADTTDLFDATARIRRILVEHGRLAVDAATLDDGADLYQAGMTSHASVTVMLALEGEFDLEFPDQLLSREVFQSIAAIRDAVSSLLVGSPPGAGAAARRVRTRPPPAGQGVVVRGVPRGHGRRRRARDGGSARLGAGVGARDGRRRAAARGAVAGGWARAPLRRGDVVVSHHL